MNTILLFHKLKNPLYLTKDTSIHKTQKRNIFFEAIIGGLLASTATFIITTQYYKPKVDQAENKIQELTALLENYHPPIIPELLSVNNNNTLQN